MPVCGKWKTLLRVHDGRILTAAPIYLAGDPGIGAPEVPAQSTMTRPFVSEITILQRERSPDTPQSLWLVGCLVVLACTLIMIGGLTWGAGRINRSRAHRHQGGASAVGPGMTPQPDVVILAHHGLLLAIPAFVPAFIVAGVVIYVAMRDRRNRDEPHSEQTGSNDQDG